MFFTELADFDYKPLVKRGKLKKGWVVTQTELVWEAIECTCTVPTGFESDLASLPWFIKPILSKLGRHQRGAILHDYLYRNQVISKAWADRQFKEAMEYDSVAGWKTKVIMSGLFVGGWLGWHKHKHKRRVAKED